MGAWTLHLKFDGDEVEYSAGILEDATIKECVGEKGKHAMQSCSVSIWDKILAAKIFNSSKDIEAKIYNGDNIVFEGVIRPYAKLTAEMAHENAIQLEVIDYGQTLHYYIYANLDDILGQMTESQKKKIIQTQVYYDISLKTLIENLFKLTELKDKVSIDVPELNIKKKYFVLEAGKYFDDIVEELLYEYCLDYRFAPGKLIVFSTKVVDSNGSAIAPSETLSDFNLSFEVNREDQANDGVELTYGVYKSTRACIYSEDNRWDRSWWDAILDLGLASFERKGFYYQRDMHETLDDLTWQSWNFPVEYSEMISVSNLEIYTRLDDETGVKYQGYCEEWNKDGGKPYIAYDGTFDYVFGRGWGFVLKIYATIFYNEKNQFTTKLLGLSPIKLTADYVEDATDAGILAANIQARNERSVYKYGFSTRTAIAPGTIVKLDESKVTGLNATVRITSRTLNPLTGLYTYEAEGAGEVTIPEVFNIYNGTNDTAMDYSYLFELETSKQLLSGSGETFTATASGMLFSNYGCTPHWELNGEALSDTGLTITLSSSDLKPGDNTLRCYTEYKTDEMKEAETLSKEVTLTLFTSGYVDYELSKRSVDCYADGYVIDDDPIELKAWASGSISLYINNELIKTGESPLSYTITPSEYLEGRRGISIKLVSGSYSKDAYISTYRLAGELELTAERTVLDYYADDYPVSEEDITVIAKATNFKGYPTIINWKGQTEYADSDTYTMKIPADALIGQSSITVTAKIGTLTRTIAITKNTLQGELELTAERTVLDYYADDVEITDGDKITVTAKATNYKAYPTIERDGVLVATGESDSVSYDVLATSLYGKSGAVIKAKIGTLTKTMEITKSYEQGNISIESDISVFGYYADNMPHNSTEYSTLAITQSGYSKMPTLYIEGVEKEYQSINESGNGTGTYAILSTELLSRASMTAKISIMDNTQLLTLYKRLDSPQISLSLSEPVAEYYYDNVAITGDIKAEVSYSGLYYAPLLKAGDTPILLSDEGKATVPISLFDDVDAGLAITAYASKNITYGTTASIQKQKRQLKLSLGISGAQFSYDSLGNPSPESITISNNTEGLSDKGKVLLVVGGESKGWDSDGKYIITPDMVTGRYLAVSIGYGSDSSTAIITKTYDGKAEEFQYSKTKSFRIYPDDEYGFVYTDEHLEYNGNEFAWLIPWSVNIPDVSSNEYLWRRSRSDSDSGWQYARMTGVKGEDGENAGGQYLGHYRTAPTERADGTAIEDGDYYLDVSTDGEPLPYRYKDGSWVLVTSSDPDWSAIASATIGDVNNYAGSLLSTSSYYGFFQLLSAQKAFIASLGTQELTLTDGGAIMSESYKASNGAEGFRIDADGNVDFNEGTFRGSFANGLSFIPPTNCIIYKTDTQREAYRKLRKALVAPGVYETATIANYTETGTVGTVVSSSSSEGSFYNNSTFLRTGNGFWCSDIASGSLSANTLLFHEFAKVIPITPKYFLGVAEEDSACSFYLFTKDMIEKAQFSNPGSDISDSFAPYDQASLKLYPQEELPGLGLKSGDLWLFYLTVVDGKMIGYDMTEDVFYLYTLDEENMKMVKGAQLQLGDKLYLTRWYIPSFVFHESVDSSGEKCWECDAWYSQTIYFNHYKLLRTYNLIDYEEIESIDMDESRIAVLDMIRVGDRIFAQIISWAEQNPIRTKDVYSARLGEWNRETGQWDYIPDKQTQFTGLEEIEVKGMPGLVEKNGVIYGTFSTHELFSYDTATNTYTDLSCVFRSGLICQNIEMYNTVGIPASPPVFASKKEYDNLVVESGKLLKWDCIAYRFDGNNQYYSCDTLPACVVARVGGDDSLRFVKLSSSSSSSSTSRSYYNATSNYTLDITITKGTDAYNVTSIYTKDEYEDSEIRFYAATSCNASYKESEDIEYTDRGLKKSTTVSVSIVSWSEDTDGKATFSLSGTVDEYTTYSTNKLWESIRVQSVQWSETKGKLIIGYSIAGAAACVLEYDIATGGYRLQSPIHLLVESIPTVSICPYAEDGDGYCFSADYALFESNENDSNRKSFAIRNPYITDLIPCVNNSDNSFEQALFTNPDDVPAFFKTGYANLMKTTIKKILLNNSKIELDGKRLFRVDDDSIEYNAIMPYLNCQKMFVRDTANEYEIYLGNALSVMKYIYYDFLPVFAPYIQDSMYLYRTLVRVDLSPNANIEPLIRIAKDSDEPVGATFIWDFPAQLSVSEGISVVHRNRIFDETVNIYNKLGV